MPSCNRNVRLCSDVALIAANPQINLAWKLKAIDPEVKVPAYYGITEVEECNENF